MMKVPGKVCSGVDTASVTTSSILPREIDADERLRFIFDDRQGYNLLFVTADMLRQPQPFTPYWVLTCRDRATLEAVGRWVAVRRDQWPAWERMAQTMAHRIFDACMHRLLANDPVMHVGATMVRQTPEQLEVAFLHVLERGTDVRSEEVVRHRFASPEAYDAFVGWLNSQSNIITAETLVKIAFAEGTDAFGRALDHLASTRPLTRQQRRALERQRAD